MVAVRLGAGAETLSPGEAFIGIRPPAGAQSPQLALVHRAARADAGPDGKIARVHVRAEHSVQVWYPQTEDLSVPGVAEEAMERLADRIEEKLRQTRLGEARRLLIADTALTAVLSGSGDPRLIRFRRQLLRKHGDMAGIFLVRRVWSNDLSSWRYQGLTVSETKGVGLPRSMVRALHTIEATGVWETTRTTTQRTA